MPFALDSNPSNIELSDAINYLLANFGANLSADPDTGLITGPTGQTIAYLYKYLSVKYADSFDGASNFSNSPTNRLYYGVRNSNDSTESTNPADYIWLRVAGGFSTTKFLFYKVSGGRQIEFFVGTTAPAYAWQQDSGTAIDLDAISVVITATPTIYQWTATSTPPARPSTATTYDWLTGTYTAPAGWSIDVPSTPPPVLICGKLPSPSFRLVASTRPHWTGPTLLTLFVLLATTEPMDHLALTATVL